MKTTTSRGKDETDLEGQLRGWRQSNPKYVVTTKHPVERLALDVKPPPWAPRCLRRIRRLNSTGSRKSKRSRASGPLPAIRDSDPDPQAATGWPINRPALLSRQTAALGWASNIHLWS
jgi:hypothetical protein